MCNVVWSFFDNILRGFYLCDVVPKVFIRKILNKIFSCAMLSGASWTTLHKFFTCTMLSQECQDNTEQDFFPVWCCLEPLRQDCTRFLPVPCRFKIVKTSLNKIWTSMLPGASWTTLHKIICAMLAQSTHTCFRWKITSTVFSWSVCPNQPCLRELLMQCWRTAHEQLCKGKYPTVLSWSMWANIAQENYLCNVGHG